jgi:tetratricopeptide (TPR) repeat protein
MMASPGQVQEYGVRDVERMLQMSRGTILGLIKAGFVSPTRGPRREYRFSFQDLIVLRTARALEEAEVPQRRITRSLKELRRRLPSALPLSGLSIRAVGDRVVVQEGGKRWQAESGQYLLELDVRVSDGELSMLAREGENDAPCADDWFNQGWDLEEKSRDKAQDAYRRALAIDPAHVGARINLGRLLHEDGQLKAAERLYREGIETSASNPLLLFNLGVLLEDAGRRDEAIRAYETALKKDPGLADCHYNLALAYEAAGDARRAIRHLGEYRKLVRNTSN